MPTSRSGFLSRCVIALGIALLGLGGSVVPLEAQSAPKKAREGARTRGTSVLVQSTSNGASIFIDDVEVGTVPMLKAVPVTPGSHTIKVVKPGHAAFLDTFEARRGQSVVLEIDLVPIAAVVEVRADAHDAVVAFDQRPVGNTPFTGEVEPGEHVLEVRATGRLTHKQSVVLVAGEVHRFQLTLLPAPPGSTDSEAGAWYGQWWVWAGAAAVVAGGVTAAILLSQDEPAPTGPRDRLPLEWVY
jgi:hypothetical protein